MYRKLFHKDVLCVYFVSRITKLEILGLHFRSILLREQTAVSEPGKPELVFFKCDSVGLRLIYFHLFKPNI